MKVFLKFYKSKFSEFYSVYVFVNILAFEFEFIIITQIKRENKGLCKIENDDILYCY